MCKQITVVLPNKPGQFYEVATILAEKGVNVLGYSISKTGYSGVLHILATPHDTAFRALEEKYSYYCSEKEVIVSEVEHEPGKLRWLLGILAENKINLPLSYQASLPGGRALIVMEFDASAETGRVRKCLDLAGVTVISSVAG